MAMVIKNNMSAQHILGEVGRNNKALSNSLKKVSSGMKINDAGDDASGYAISERMRVQIRGLEQDIRNCQNGISLMKVAEGAVASSIAIMRTMKEKALDAANDTNTDLDRATIQKELDEVIDQIDDNANVTYNGKYLINGEMQVKIDTDREQIVAALNTEWIANSLERIEQAYGLTFRDGGTTVREMDVKFVENPGAFALATCAWTSGADGQAKSLTMTINMSNVEPLNMESPDGLSRGGTLDRTIAHELTHALMAANINYLGALPTFIVEGTASYIQGFDDWTGTLASHDRSWLQTKISSNSTHEGGSNDPYEAGYIFLRYLTAQSPGDGQEVIRRFMASLSTTSKQGIEALDEAVEAASKGKFATRDDVLDSLLADFDTLGDMTAFLKDFCGIDLTNKDVGSTLGSDAGGSKAMASSDVVPEAGSTRFWYLPSGGYSSIGELLVKWPDGSSAKMGKFTLQTGTKANQAMKLSFNDMRAEGLGLKDKDGKKISVRTRDDANDTIRVVDEALQKAIEQQTTIGAIQSRLEFTISNLTTASENVQSSESTIRDADMAREMTEYTKANVLLQAAQSMLAQANQSSSTVLSLLQ